MPVKTGAHEVEENGFDVCLRHFNEPDAAI
jgi:hypothetical protein